MTKIEKAKHDAFIQVLNHCDENIEVVKLVRAVETLLQSARLLVNNINHTDQKRLQKKDGFADAREAEKNNLIFTATGFANVIYAFADISKNLALKAAADISKTDLEEAGSGLPRMASNILDMAKENSDALKDYGLTEALTENFARLIETYEKAAAMPRTAEAIDQNDTKELKAMMKEATHLFNKRLRPLMSVYKFTHREFYEQYLIKQKVLDPITRTTRINGIIINSAGTPIPQALVELPATSLSTLTDEKGEFLLKVPYTPFVSLNVSAGGYASGQVLVKLTKGKSARCMQTLEK